MNYSSLTSMYESIFAQMYIILVEIFFCNFCLKIFQDKKQKLLKNLTEIHTFGPKYFHTYFSWITVVHIHVNIFI